MPIQFLPLWRRAWPLLIALVLLIFLIHRAPAVEIRFKPAETPTPAPSEVAVSTPDSKVESKVDSKVEIPNIVHQVRMFPRRNEDDSTPHPTFDYTFANFLSIYSAYLYLKPEVIYIHTNAPPEVIAAERTSSNKWTRAIANLPSVQFHYEELPGTHSKTHGTEIWLIQHIADFVRSRVMRKFGGIYMDEDVFALRDFTPLRQTGFKAVVGYQKGNVICNAMYMGLADSHIVQALDELQDPFFNGGWTTHSVLLLTRITRDIAAADSKDEVLVLEQNAFFPLSWEIGDLDTMYAVHDDWDGSEKWQKPADLVPFNLTSYADRVVSQEEVLWPFDTTYSIHGWHSAIQPDVQYVFGDYGEITVDYILARKSYFAKAVYPALQHALDAGTISRD